MLWKIKQLLGNALETPPGVTGVLVDTGVVTIRLCRGASYAGVVIIMSRQVFGRAEENRSSLGRYRSCNQEVAASVWSCRGDS